MISWVEWMVFCSLAVGRLSWVSWESQVMVSCDLEIFSVESMVSCSLETSLVEVKASCGLMLPRCPSQHLCQPWLSWLLVWGCHCRACRRLGR